MSKVYFYSDPHLGHEFMAELRGFKSVKEHNEFIIYMWNYVVTKRDKVFVLGDFTGGSAHHYPLIDQLNGLKVGVLGNHDDYKKVKRLLEHVHAVAGVIKYKGYFLTHIPIHPKEFEYRSQAIKGNIHGHTHENRIELDPRYINVSAEAINYLPKEFSEIELLFNQQNKEKR